MFRLRCAKKLEQSTNGINSATILIADRKGKEEIVRAIRGLPSNLRSKSPPPCARDAAARRAKAGGHMVQPVAGLGGVPAARGHRRRRLAAV
jgi:hypothetical protein